MGSDGPAGLAELLYRYRTAAGLTQEELAEQARLSARAISDLERGTRTRPHVSTVRQLADALRLSAEDKSALQLAARRHQAPHLSNGQVETASPWTVEVGSHPLVDGAGRPRESRQRLPIGGFLGSLPSGRLVARAEELARILEAVETVGAGQGRLLLLAGEAGIGKTRLAQELTRAVYDREFLVAAGRCYEPHQSMPYYPFLEALRMTYSASPPTLREQASHRWPYLARLMPDHLAPAPIPSGEAEEQERLFRAVAAFVLAAAEIRPLALLLDDLHWADSASLQLLQHLARQTRGSRVLLLGTYRDLEVRSQDPLEATLRDLRREQLVERLALRRLEESGTAAFIAETMGDLEAAEEFTALVHEDAVQLLESAVSRAESVGSLHTLSDALNFASLAYHSLRKLDRCLAYRARAVEVAERLGSPAEISYRAVEAAEVTFLVGDWGRSRMYVEQAVSSALTVDDPRALLHPLCVLGELCLYTGDWEVASHYLDDSVTLGEHFSRVDDLRDIQAVLAERDLLQGDRVAALARLQPLLATPGWEEHLNYLLAVSAARLATGDLVGAGDAVVKAIAEVECQRLPVGLVDALRLYGAIAAERGQWEEAKSRLQRAIDLARDIAYPWGEARALYEYGLMFAAKGEADRAAEQLEAASAIFRRLGAEPYRARADQAATELDTSHGRP